MMLSDKTEQGIFIHIHVKGWVNENIMKLLIEKVWWKYPGSLLKMPAVLVCDQFRSHVMKATKRMVKELNT
jgi:hypothetical protein